MMAGVRYLTYSGRELCWGCARRLEAWHSGDRANPMPPAAERARWRRVDGKGTEWLLCSGHKNLWEGQDMLAKRKQRRR